MTNLPILLYVVLFLAALLAPLRWSIVAFLLLSNIDLGSLDSSIGAMNTAKAMVLPVLMLWRFRAYAGHGKIGTAPVAWGLLIVYIAVASAWSQFPAFAIKLIGHLLGSLIICLMLIRATKGGYLTAKILLPVSIGTLGIATIHWFFLHDWGGETERFTTFAGAQSFAAFVTALYCAALSLKSLRLALRVTLCTVLFFSVLLNGSRIWIIGLFASTLLAIFVSEAKTLVKALTLALTLIVGALSIADLDGIMDLIAQQASSNRIAEAVTDIYGGNFRASGLGTYNLRHELYQRTMESIETSSVLQLVFGHGTCNGALITATVSKNPDPNRAMHNEWLRVIYEWGIVGLTIWLVFIGALVAYAVKGVNTDRGSYSKPLLIYLPAFALGLSGENIIAGAGNAVSVGLLVLIALASISHRPLRRSVPGRFRRVSVPSLAQALSPAVPRRFNKQLRLENSSGT